MTNQELLNVFERAVMVEENTLTIDTLLADIEEWDSLALATLLTSVEEEVAADLNAADFRNAKNIGDIISLISSKIGQD